MYFRIVYLSLVLVFCYGQAAGRFQDEFTWSQCDDGKTFSIDYLDAKPYPVKFPGDIFFSLNMTLLRELNESDIAIDIYKKTFMGNLWVPCFYNFGSCTYRNACSLMDRMIDENWGGFMSPMVSQLKKILINNGVDMSCPVLPQELRLHDERLSMPTIPSFLRFLTGGEYFVKVSSIDEKGRKKVNFCLDMGGT